MLPVANLYGTRQPKFSLMKPHKLIYTFYYFFETLGSNEENQMTVFS